MTKDELWEKHEMFSAQIGWNSAIEAVAREGQKLIKEDPVCAHKILEAIKAAESRKDEILKKELI